MIVLLTDFGIEGPYIGQVKAVLAQEAPGAAVIDLFSDLPPWDPRAAAYLLAAYQSAFPDETVFLAVVDPGVGDPQRKAVALRLDNNWYVGPDNGIFSIVARRAREEQWFDIVWKPEKLSNSFHGRDLFAPVAARLALERSHGRRQRRSQDLLAMADGWQQRVGHNWEDEYAGIVYIDRFGNALTGLRGADADPGRKLRIAGRELGYAKTFSAFKKGQPFWYVNSNGLIEVAVNQGRAVDVMGIQTGDEVGWIGEGVA